MSEQVMVWLVQEKGDLGLALNVSNVFRLFMSIDELSKGNITYGMDWIGWTGIFKAVMSLGCLGYQTRGLLGMMGTSLGGWSDTGIRV